jgi:hypothetical protein
MPTILRFRRGDSTAAQGFTGVEGELYIDTTKDTIRVHDGSTVGGHIVATEAWVNSGTFLNQVNVGVTGANVIDTISGNLVLEAGSGIVEVNGDVSVVGNLSVTGTTTTLNTEEVLIKDNIIVLNSTVVAAPTQDSGIEIERGTSSNVRLMWDETTDTWVQTRNGTDYVVLPVSTAELAENTNLYFTDARARSAISAGTGISYDSGTGIISSSTTQYTDADARQSVVKAVPVSAKGDVGDIAGTIAGDAGFLYFCHTDYTDGVDDIWSRVAIATWA